MHSKERWIVLCGSMSAHQRMLDEQHELEGAGLVAILPPSDDHVMAGLAEHEYHAAKRTAAMAHFKKVMDSRTCAVLAVNADKHGMRDYVGPNTFAELAIAFVNGKKIYLLQDMPRNLEDELKSWGAIALRGDLSRLIEEYYSECAVEEGAGSTSR